MIEKTLGKHGPKFHVLVSVGGALEAKHQEIPLMEKLTTFNQLERLNTLSKII